MMYLDRRKYGCRHKRKDGRGVGELEVEVGLRQRCNENTKAHTIYCASSYAEGRGCMLVRSPNSVRITVLDAAAI